jgi:mannan polymerase II complex MNN11 subunit
MHFALPPRKTSQPPPYLPRTSRLPGLRRSRVKLIALAGLAFLTLLYLLTRSSSSSSGHAASAKRAPRGTPPVVMVTVLDHSKYNMQYLEMVKENRIKYAEKHGMSPTESARSDAYN